MPMWFLFALSAAILWAVGQVLFKKGLTHISPLWNIIFSALINLFILVPAVLLLSNFHIVIPSLPILLAIFVAAATYMIFPYAAAKANISLTGTIWAIYPVSTIILSFIFLGERLTIVQIVGVIIALLGVIVIALPEKNFVKILFKHSSWFWLAFIGTLINGSGDFLIKLATNHIGAYSQIFFLVLSSQVLFIFNYLLDKKGRKLPKFSIKKFFPTLIALTLFVIGNFLFFVSFNFGKASLIAPVSSIYPAFMVLLATIFLREKITRKQLIGIFIIIFGVVLLGA